MTRFVAIRYLHKSGILRSFVVKPQYFTRQIFAQFFATDERIDYGERKRVDTSNFYKNGLVGYQMRNERFHYERNRVFNYRNFAANAKFCSGSASIFANFQAANTKTHIL